MRAGQCALHPEAGVCLILGAGVESASARQLSTGQVISKPLAQFSAVERPEGRLADLRRLSALLLDRDGADVVDSASLRAVATEELSSAALERMLDPKMNVTLS